MGHSNGIGDDDISKNVNHIYGEHNIDLTMQRLEGRWQEDMYLLTQNMKSNILSNENK
jgi:hypothetical protein